MKKLKNLQEIKSKLMLWLKQDARERFKETFKLKKNQLALTRGLQRNRLALTSGLEKINETNLRLADMRELPGLEGDYEEPSASAKSPTRYNIEKNLDNVDLGVLSDMG